MRSFALERAEEEDTPPRPAPRCSLQATLATVGRDTPQMCRSVRALWTCRGQNVPDPTALMT